MCVRAISAQRIQNKNACTEKEDIENKRIYPTFDSMGNTWKKEEKNSGSSHEERTIWQERDIELRIKRSELNNGKERIEAEIVFLVKKEISLMIFRSRERWFISYIRDCAWNNIFSLWILLLKTIGKIEECLLGESKNLLVRQERVKRTWNRQRLASLVLRRSDLILHYYFGSWWHVHYHSQSI